MIKGMRIVVGLFLAVLLSFVEASAFTARATVDRNALTEGESVTLTVTMTDGTGEVDTSAIKDFAVTSRGSSTSIQIINGAMKREQHLAFLLTPLRTGTLLIPALPVRDGGQNVMTDPIRIDVGRAEAGKSGGDGDLLMTASVSDARPFEGQEIVYTFRFLAAVPVASARYQKPSFEGFTVREAGAQKETTTVINGRKYQVTEVSYLLTPTKSGSLSIEPGTLVCEVPDRPSRRGSPFGSLFDDPFFSGGRTVTRSVRSEAIPITVRPLPPDASGRFSGLIGSFQFKADLDLRELSVGDSATLTITVEGKGNIPEAGPPKLDLPASFKVYPDTPKEEVSSGAGGTRGKKIFRFALVPVEPGEFRIGPFSYVVFDPKGGEYRQLNAPAVTVRVTSGSGTGVSARSLKPAPTAPPPPTPGPVPDVPELSLPGPDVLAAVRAWVLPMGLALAAAVLLWLSWSPLLRVIRRFRQRDKGPSEMMRERALGILKEAERGNEDSGGVDPLQPLRRALTTAVLAVSGRTGESITYEEARSWLLEAGLPEDEAKSVVSLLSRIDSIHYGAPQSGDPSISELRSEVITRVRQLLARA